MTTFDMRKNEAEARFTRDQELQFKATARRNKLLGLWAAELLGLGGDDAAAYAKEVVIADFDRPGDDDVLEKVLKDLTAAGVEITNHKLRKEMDRLMDDARAQVMAE
ncbi:MAG: DUF1476 domain-containing protein [Proteobacteria bacterium]|nr:DUF1476 domain-containing protein [Pseudomonadota bacterium]